MKNLYALIIFTLSLTPDGLWAQTGTNATSREASSSSVVVAPQSSTSMPTTSSTTGKTSKKLDELIDDPVLRARAGSNSKYSASMTLFYDGASIKKPMGDDRPNVRGAPVAPPVRAAGNVGFRYRIKPTESLFFATGYTHIRPFSEDQKGKMELSSPRVMWNMTDKISDIQLSSTAGVAYITTEFLNAIGQRSTAFFDLSALANPNRSRFDVGATTRMFYSYFDKDSAAIQRRQMDYSFSISPILQYRAADRVRIFTSLGLLDYFHLRSNESLDFTKNVVTQSLGATFAVTRDVVISPTIEFRPSQLRAENTALNLSATINMF